MFSIFGSSLAVLGVKIPLSSVFSYGPAIGVALFSLPSFISVLRQKKLRGLLIFVLVGLIAFCAQIVAVKTSFVSGKFAYDSILGRQLFGVPWIIALAYPPVILGAYWLARKLTNGWMVPFVTAAFVTLCGTVLDPVAVKLEFWKWEHGGKFWGVPPINFAAWFITALLAAWITQKIWGDKQVKRGAAFSALGIMLFWTGANLGTDQWIPAAIGGAMSVVILIIMWREKHRAVSEDNNPKTLAPARAR